LFALLVLPWLWAWTPGPSPNVVPLLVSWACIALASVILVGAAGRDKPVHQVLPAAWLAAACANAAIGLVQWFGLASELPLAAGAAAGEAFGNLRQRNQLATLTSLGLLSALWFHSAKASIRNHAWVVLLALGNAVSVSRTGLVQWSIVPLLILAWPLAARPALWRLWATAFSAYLAAALLLPWLLHATQGVMPASLFGRVGHDLGCSSRAVLWSNVLHLVAQKPWAGWGAGELDFAHFTTLYPGARFCDILDNAHNLPLHLAVEFGLPLALGACLALLWGVVRLRPWAERQPQRLLAWAVLAMIGLHSLLEYPLWYGPFQLAVVLAAWLLLPRLRVPPATQRVFAAAAAVLMVMLAYAYRSYDLVSEAYRPPQERRAAFRADPITPLGKPLLFQDQLQFAELITTPLSRASSARVHELAERMLHYSPEPRVVEKLIESAMLLGRDDEALWHARRYQAAFAQEYERWAAGAKPAGP
jgi:O-antigen ligase